MTKQALVKEAMILIRRKGHSSFSYADLVTKIGISKACIHHHFPSEEMLG
ncbi:TetR family transcriptional regulator [Pectobacterium brasiliense]|nr:TetR family transcriptional regulator [Pectobacterium brasiliense]